jgi:epoxyqueuosine reductase
MIQISKRERFYQQEYCGCVYSLRDTNRKRRKEGRADTDWGEVLWTRGLSEQ